MRTFKIRFAYLLLPVILFLITFSSALASPMDKNDIEFHELNISEALIAYKGKYTTNLNNTKEYFVVSTSAELMNEIENCLYRWGINRERFRVVEQASSPTPIPPMTDNDIEFHKINISEALVAYKGKYTTTLSNDKRYMSIYTSADLINEIDDCLYRWGISRGRFKVIEKTSGSTKTPSPRTATSNASVQAPELKIIACTIIPDLIYETQEFTVEVVVHNLSDIPALDALINYGSDAIGLSPVAEENAIQLGRIESGASITTTFKFMAMDGIQVGDNSFLITLDYVDEDNNSYTISETYTATIVYLPVFTYDPIILPEEIPAGQQITMPVKISNTGKCSLHQVTVTLEGAGLFPASALILGDIPPGEDRNGEIMILAGALFVKEDSTEQYGQTQAVCTLTYQDDVGKEYTTEVMCSTQISEPVYAMDNQGGGASVPWWFVAIIIVAILAFISTILLFVKAKQNK